jgi:hypothetical protein
VRSSAEKRGIDPARLLSEITQEAG